ncbi:MAG: hypothetical protein J6B75_03445 [Ruminococcus sp.]|nr:hypothetical protein [Ruminococcus sp.]
MRFYIDFENVGVSGLVGIDALTDTDSVRIYYSNNPNVDMQTVENIVHSSAKIQFIKLPDTLKMMNLSNALDIVLLSDISRIAASLGSNYAVVISYDKGFDAVISELNTTNKLDQIIRSDSIKSALIQCSKKSTPVSNKVDAVALNLLFSRSLSKYVQHKDKIIKIVQTSKTRCEINNKVNQTFDCNQAKIIMSSLKPIIKCLPGQ